METAQHLVAQTIGILVVAWVVGYTLLRAHEAVAASAEHREQQPSQRPVPDPATATLRDEQGEDLPGRGSMAYAARRWQDGSLTAPWWALIAGAASGARWIRRKTARGPGEHKPRRTRDDKRDGRPEGGGDTGRPDSSRDRADGPEGSGESTDRGARNDRRDAWWKRPRSGEDQDPHHREQPHREGHDDQDDVEIDVDVEVEVIRTRPTPRTPPPALGTPIPALTAPGRDQPPASRPATSGSGGPVLPPIVPSEPEVAASVVTTLDRTERTKIDMGHNLAVPGSGAKTATSVGGKGLAPSGSHDADMALSRKIETAVDMSYDTVAEAEAKIRASLRAAWASLDALAAAGIGGHVITQWSNAVLALEEARKGAGQLLALTVVAKDAVTAAKRTQGRKGDAIQRAVTAAGKSAANSTRYYGKS